MKLEIRNQRMLQLMDYAITNKIVADRQEWAEKIRCNYGVIGNVKLGTQSFTFEHMRNACLITGANLNWLADIERDMFRQKGKNKSAIQLLREATAAVEGELSKKKEPKRPEILN